MEAGKNPVFYLYPTLYRTRIPPWKQGGTTDRNFTHTKYQTILEFFIQLPTDKLTRIFQKPENKSQQLSFYILVPVAIKKV
jgi:hypothetical protein